VRRRGDPPPQEPDRGLRQIDHVAACVRSSRLYPGPCIRFQLPGRARRGPIEGGSRCALGGWFASYSISRAFAQVASVNPNACRLQADWEPAIRTAMHFMVNETARYVPSGYNFNCNRNQLAINRRIFGKILKYFRSKHLGDY